MRFLLISMMVVSGFFVSFQGPINARLRLAVESPVLGATISFLTGTLLLFCLTGAGVFGGIGAGLEGVLRSPWWAYLGGALGVTFVLGSIVAIPHIGAVVVICAAIFGQMMGSFLADTFGWFGLEKTPFSPLRLLGLGLVLVGVLLVQKK
jgi:bacterial/archaeal transporter family-2 protein